MERITTINTREIEGLRARYRSTRSVVDLVRYIIGSGIEQNHGDHQLVLMDTFLLKHSQMRHFVAWLEDAELQRINGYLTNEEFDQHMDVEIETTRSLWDKAAAKD
jgi:hypothetical protein